MEKKLDEKEIVCEKALYELYFLVKNCIIYFIDSQRKDSKKKTF